MRRFAAIVCLAIAPCAAMAQSTPDTAAASRSLFIHQDLYIVGAFTAGTVLMFPLDRHLASVVRDEDLVTNQRLRDVSSVFRFFGGPGPYLIGAGLYVVGRTARWKRVAELGLHGTEAVVVGQAVSGVLKVTLGRARPYISADTNPRNFEFGRGLRSTDFQSFPSGHSTSAFAAAAAVQAEAVEWWPKSKWIIRPIVYGGASLVALSRIYEDKHWASDVVMGAAIGTFAGLKVVRFNHTHHGNRIDRWLLGTASEGASSRIIGGPHGAGFEARIVW